MSSSFFVSAGFVGFLPSLFVSTGFAGFFLSLFSALSRFAVS